MSITAIKSEIASLPLEERRDLIGYIVSLNRKDNESFMRNLAEKIDDNTPERWVTIDEAKRTFADDEPSNNLLP